MPCVFLLSIHLLSVMCSLSCSTSHSRSTTTFSPPLSSGKCPPLSNTHLGPNSPRALAASLMASIPCILPLSHPRRSSASGTLGVRTVASGRSAPRRVAMASLGRSWCPLVLAHTGSTTSGGRDEGSGKCEVRVETSARICAALVSMPVLRASTPMSLRTEDSCEERKEGERGATSCTPSVFWAAWIPITHALSANARAVGRRWSR